MIIHVNSVQTATSLTVVHLAVIMVIICNISAQREAMNVNGVIRGLVHLYVDRDIGETRVRLDVQIIASNVHQIQRARIV